MKVDGVNIKVELQPSNTPHINMLKFLPFITRMGILISNGENLGMKIASVNIVFKSYSTIFK